MSSSPKVDRQREVALLLHGLAGSKLDMLMLSRRLAAAGFRTRNWSYPSILFPIERHAGKLFETLVQLERDDSVDRVHLVGHSMGSIVIRAAVAEAAGRSQPLAKLQRLVLLAPPNRGSHIARKMSPWLGWACPGLSQLSDAPESYVNQLGNVFAQQGLEFGIVEASKDRVIARGAADLEGRADFASVVGHHAILTWYPQTLRLVESFLRHGCFDVDAVTSQRLKN